MGLIGTSLSRVLISVLLSGMAAELYSIQTGHDSNSGLFGFIFIASYLILTILNIVLKRKNSPKKSEENDQIIDSE